MITPTQCRAGRALVDWSQGDLAKAAGVSLSSIRDFELGVRGATPGISKGLERAFADAGVVLIPGNNNGGEGVRLALERPSLLTKPVGIRESVLTFGVAYLGKRVVVKLSEEALEDLASEYGLPAPENDKDALFIFEGTIDRILRSIAAKTRKPGAIQPDGVLYLLTPEIVK
jgi:transcriptional regulator with XRE-family HTH domain